MFLITQNTQQYFTFLLYLGKKTDVFLKTQNNQKNLTFILDLEKKFFSTR